MCADRDGPKSAQINATEIKKYKNYNCKKGYSPCQRNLSTNVKVSVKMKLFKRVLVTNRIATNINKHRMFRFVYLSVSRSVCTCVLLNVCYMRVCVCLSVCLYICLSVCLSVCSSVRPSVRLSVSLYVCLSVCLYNNSKYFYCF
jgi:hypothetical protein